MRKGSGGLYQRGESWYGRIKIEGEEYRTSLSTSNRKEAESKLKRWIETLRDTIDKQQSLGDSFQSVCLRWNSEYLASGNVKPNTAKRYLISLRSLDTVFGNLHMGEITRSRVGEFVSGRIGSASNSTIRRDLTALSSILECAKGWGLIDTNPALDYNRKLIREPKRIFQPPTDEEVFRLIDNAPQAMRKLIMLLDQSGMRAEEGNKLEVGQIDIKRQQLILTRTKSSKPRVLDFKTSGGDITEAISEMPKSGFVFVNENGGNYGNLAGNWIQLINRMQAKFPDFRRFRCHDLRHGFAIRWLKNGGGIYGLKQQLGHSNVSTTEIYLQYLGASEQDRAKI